MTHVVYFQLRLRPALSHDSQCPLDIECCLDVGVTVVDVDHQRDGMHPVGRRLVIRKEYGGLCGFGRHDYTVSSST